MLKSKIHNPSDRSRISVLCKDDKLIEKYFDDVEAHTLYELFQSGLRKYPDGGCLGTRKENAYEWKSYREVDRLARNVGASLVQMGMEPHKQTSMIGLYSKNRWEYDVTQLSCYYYGLIAVPIYETLGKEGCSFIVNQIECQIICVDGTKPVDDYLSIIQGSKVKTIVYYSHPSDEDVEKLNENGFKVAKFPDLFVDPDDEDEKIEIQPAKEEDLALILYTSGTTGLPKGVMLTHKSLAIVAGCGLLHMSKSHPPLSPSNSDIGMSYLPSAHVFNNVFTYLLFYGGCRIGYFSGSILTLMEDVAILQPTIFPIVPRLLNRLYNKAIQGVNSAPFLLRKLFWMAMEQKQEELEKGIPVTRSTFLSSIAFKKVKASLGGRIRFMIIGSAPVSGKVLNFTRIVFGCEIMEAYGQTETAGASTATLPHQYAGEMVGGPLPCCECKLVSIPEMNYDAEQDEGEICFRGYNMFKGYLKDAAKTKETIDADGWVHTGDIGRWLEDGSLKIIDRKKHIFKLSQGEYIAPEKLESGYAQVDLIAQLFVHGNSLESCLVAIIVPEFATIRTYIGKNALAVSRDASDEDLCNDAAVKELILNKIKDKAKELKFNSLEVPKDVHLEHQMFSIDNGLLTPTMKNKRPELKKQYTDKIDAMYEKMNTTSN